jgi:hypothetical protein
MSHEITYKHLAVRFPVEILQAVLPDEFFFRDQFILLELHGSNNTTTSHPITGREVCSRHWSVLAFGEACYVMQDAVKVSSYCETGGLRLTGNRSTSPETYIRAVRNTMKSPVTPVTLISNCFSMTARLEANRPNLDQSRIELIKQWVPCTEREGESPHWLLHPLSNPLHAAILMHYGTYVDQRSLYDIFSIEGPCFPGESSEIFMRT